MPRGDLFPDISPYETGALPLGDGHVMYWEQVGNPTGAAVLFLHGGPGAGAGAVHRRFFDPSHWRMVIFDQRGAGRSAPLGLLDANTTPHLVADIEVLRRHLGLSRWLVFGGSWGATLALAYAQAHPDRVAGMVLRGIFLGRQVEIDWFLHGMAAIFPEAHARFAGFLPLAERGDLLAAYLRRLTDPDPAVHMPAAQAWATYEGSCSTLMPTQEAAPASVRLRLMHDRAALGLARLEAHYFAHGLFLPPGGLLAHMDGLADIPAAIIQGRYDMICPPHSAHALAAAWPSAQLTMIPDAGHSALEPGTRRALVAAVERFRRI